MITRIMCEILKIGQKEGLIFFFPEPLQLLLCMSILSFISAVNQVAERVQLQQPAFVPALSALLYFDHYFAPRPFGGILADNCRQRSLSDGFHLSPFSKALSEREGEGGHGINVKDLCCNWRTDGRKKNWTSSADRKSESRTARRDSRGRPSSDRLLRKDTRKTDLVSPLPLRSAFILCSVTCL